MESANKCNDKIINEGDFFEKVNSVSVEKMIENFKPFNELMMYYQCAMMEVKTKLEVLNHEFSVNYKRNPVETIKYRIKRPASILEKMDRRGLPHTISAIEENITDIAGIRVICSFVEDIYKIADMLTSQDDIRLIRKKDYIKNPKPNGYRSLHLLVEVPIFLAEQKKFVVVEVQIRTAAQDFWASIEHKIKYKKNVEEAAALAERLRICAEKTAELDLEMQEIGKELLKARGQEDLIDDDDIDSIAPRVAKRGSL